MYKSKLISLNQYINSFNFSFVEAKFSLPITDSVAEADNLYIACVMLTTEAGVTLDVNISVNLNTTDNTGEV